VKIQRALISVSDRTGLAEFCRRLVALQVELIASTGTAGHLREQGLCVGDIEQLTGRSELLGGRVKTLHPAIHAGILARRDQPEDMEQLAALGYVPIDMVVCNLYPFAERLAQEYGEDALRESIDIGGPAMLRAAAKNWPFVAAVPGPSLYEQVAAELEAHSCELSTDTRLMLAARTFEITAAYDRQIAEWTLGLTGAAEDERLFPQRIVLEAQRSRLLRYGENPHQKAALYLLSGQLGAIARARLVKVGKDLSFNNYPDADAAWRIVQGFEAPAACVVKHLTPCGLATADTAAQALRDAIAGDPLSAFGSVIAVNRPFDGPLAEALIESKLFVEIVVAPRFERNAVEALERKPQLRLLQCEPGPPPELEFRPITGGLLVQQRDLPWVPTRFEPAGKTSVPPEDHESLTFAWQAVAAVRSNAIVLAQGTRMVGVGGGQTSRVDAVHMAIRKAGERARGALLASDAFFPFADGVELAAVAGVRGIIQPGGSKRDAEVIAAADKAGIYMVFTGRRCFRH
jgi:phosphoribosylaminoimidazolecarboxamide formyltransferase/IMP cyclohydrolase